MTPPAPRSASASTSAPASAPDKAELRTAAADVDAAEVGAADVDAAEVDAAEVDVADVDVDDERDSDAPTGERIARPRQPVAAPPGPTLVAAAPTVAPPAVGLTEREERILAFERQWWKHAGAKEQAIRDQFEISATRYYQAVNKLLDNPAALAADPVLVRRLRRLRATRARARRATS